eukprot:Skav216308  [mRNA]  locus=scaffold494:224423:237830:- [translate_table: standard]
MSALPHNTRCSCLSFLVRLSGIAQVHRATLRAEFAEDGQSLAVAVKVQNRAQHKMQCSFVLESASHSAGNGLVLSWHAFAVWTYDYTRQQLADELDFRVEAAHAKRAQEELDAGHVVSRQRLLIMEWIDSLGPASDAAALQKANLKPSDIMRTAVEDAAELFASLTQFRRVRLGEGRLANLAKLYGGSGSPDAQAQLKARAKKILGDTSAFPREMLVFRVWSLRGSGWLLFVGRSLNMIRSANFALGTAVNRVAILAECAAAGRRSCVKLSMGGALYRVVLWYQYLEANAVNAAMATSALALGLGPLVMGLVSKAQVEEDLVTAFVGSHDVAESAAVFMAIVGCVYGQLLANMAAACWFCVCPLSAVVTPGARIGQPQFADSWQRRNLRRRDGFANFGTGEVSKSQTSASGKAQKAWGLGVAKGLAGDFEDLQSTAPQWPDETEQRKDTIPTGTVYKGSEELGSQWSVSFSMWCCGKADMGLGIAVHDVSAAEGGPAKASDQEVTGDQQRNDAAAWSVGVLSTH